MDSQLNTEARTQLRQFLRTHFTLEELKDLAFEIGFSFESDINAGALSRTLIEDGERKQSLACLIKKMIEHRPTVDISHLVRLLAKLSPCNSRAKVQLISRTDKQLPAELLAKIAEWAGTPTSDVELIGAVPGSIYLLTSLSEAKAKSLLKFWTNKVGENQYKVTSTKNFETLTPLAQIIWRVLVVYSPFSKLALLEIGLSWKEITEIVKRGQAVTADIHPEIPQPALFNYYGGLILLRVKNWESAILNFGRSLEVMPHFAEAHLRRGIAYYHAGQYGAALADFNEAFKDELTLVEAYNYRGALYANAGENTKALADFNQALQLDPNSSISYTNRGSVFYHLRQYKAALTDFNRAISFDPLNKRAYVCRGFTWAKLRRNVQALSDFHRAIDLDPHDAQTYAHRGIIHERLGSNRQARLDFQAALRLDPNNKQARRIMQELNAAEDESSSRYPNIIGGFVDADVFVEGTEQAIEVSFDIEAEQ